MKRLSVALTVLMLSAGALTACSGNSDTLAQTDRETQSQWGLTINETDEETEAEAEKETENEKETDENKEDTASVVITELDDGIKMVGIDDMEIQSVSPVNVRSGPGTDYEKIGGLLNEETVIMDGICDNEWIHIRFDDKEGYVSMEFMQSLDEEITLEDLLQQAQDVIENGGALQEESQESEQETEEETTAKETEKETKEDTTAKETKKNNSGNENQAWATIDVNVRKGPGSNYDSVGVLKQNESVTVLDNSDAWWWKVEFNGQEAYVSVQYLTTDEPAE